MHMKIFNKILATSALVAAITFGLTGSGSAATTTVDLGTANNFAILAGTPNITTVGATTITGDVGLSPATGAGIGLTAAQVAGTIYAVDAFGPVGSVNNPGLLTIAKNDLTTAFNDAAGRTPVTTVNTELGGTTKNAGVYDSNSSTFGITAGAGPLVLDGQGDPSAVFIFEMNAEGTGLTVGPGSIVSLINGAQACNVFWRVDTATIDTTAVFKGNILALNSITVANGANIEGRLLARNGNVTLINDTVAAAICAVTPAQIPTQALTSTSPSNQVTVPSLPNTGVSDSTPWKDIAILAGIFMASMLVIIIQRKKTTQPV